MIARTAIIFAAAALALGVAPAAAQTYRRHRRSSRRSSM
jgi:hypothetical protein